MNNSHERISKARTMLILDHPFFGALSLRLKIIEDKGKTKNMATDGRAIYYNDKYIEGLPDDELLGLIAHEVMHPAMQHHTRRGNRDAKRWNKACDLAINGPLIEAGFKLPLSVPVDPRHTGNSAESIYNVLEEEEQNEDDKPQQSPGAGNGGGGEGNDDGDGDGQPDEAPGGVMDAQDMHEDASEWQLAVKQAAQAAQMMGQLPANMARLVQEANRPRTDWRALLLRFAQDQSKNDYSWKMPNRRYMPQGIYLPEQNDTQMGEMVVAIDTSGSINDDILRKFMGAIEGIADQVKPRNIKVIMCDARIHKIHDFARDEPIEGVELIGGGGTDFRPVFDHIDEGEEKPVCAVYLTDGYGSFPDKAPEVPTLWVMTTDCQAPFGEVVRLETDEERER